MKNVAKNLSLPADAWQTRISALQKLTRLVEGGAHHLSTFAGLFMDVRDLMVVQIADLRSAVVREVCSCLVVLSAAMGDEFEPFADYFIPHLLKLTFVAISIISTSGHTCINSIIRHSRIHYCIKEVIQNAQTPNDPLRKCCMQYIFTMLQYQNNNVFERFAGLITDQIKRGIGDKSTEVRLISRKCYWALRQRWPARGDELLVGFDAKTQKLIMHLEHTWDDDIDDGKRKLAMPAKAAKKASRKSVGGLISTGVARAVRVQSAEAESSPPRSPVMTRRKSLGGGASLAKMTPAAMREPRLTDSSAAPVSSLRSGAVRVSRPVEKVAVEVVGGGASIDTNNSNKENETAKSKAAKTPRTPRAKTPRSLGQDRSEDSRLASTDASGMYTHVHLQPVIAQGSSKLWSARLQCFQDLQGVFESAPTPASQSEVLLNLDRLVNLFDAKLMDPHHQVALAALAAMRSLLTCQHLDKGDIKSYHLERLMPSVFHQLTNSKAPIRQSANQLLNELATKFSQEWLLSVLTIVLDRQVIFSCSIHKIFKLSAKCHFRRRSTIRSRWAAWSSSCS